MGPINNEFQTNINIKTENNHGYTLNQYIEESKEALYLLLSANDYILIEEGELNINNQNAYILEYAYNFRGFPLRVKQVILFQKDTSYIITFTSLQNTFEDYVDEFDDSISAFNFLSKGKLMIN